MFLMFILLSIINCPFTRYSQDIHEYLSLIILSIYESIYLPTKMIVYTLYNDNDK